MTWADLVLTAVHSQAPSIPWEFAKTVLGDKFPEEQLMRNGTVYNPERVQQAVDLVVDAWLLDTAPKYKVIEGSCIAASPQSGIAIYGTSSYATASTHRKHYREDEW